MLPIILNVRHIRLILTGEGKGLLRRLGLLLQSGPPRLEVWTKDKIPKGSFRLCPRLPESVDMTGAAVFAAGFSHEKSRALAAQARAAPALVNVEDMPDLCDFHVPAILRRGDMILTASTSGRAPALASALARDLAQRYPSVWEERLETLASKRRSWQAAGLSFSEVAARAQKLIEDEKWLP